MLPNFSIALRILLTIPSTAASGERSFLKLIKNYLRSITSQEQLNSFAVLSTKCNIVKALGYTEIIREFANSRARKVAFSVVNFL